MKLPGGDNAAVDLEKLTGYCLNPEHPRGKHKARVFATAAGFTAQNAEQLKSMLLTAAATGDATKLFADQFGVRYVLDFAVDGSQSAATIRSLWIMRSGENFRE